MKLANSRFLSKINIFLLIVIFLLLVIKYIGFSKIANTFLYYKNGSYLDINHYRIEFPIGHWAYFGESEITYVVSGNNIGKNSLSAEFFKNTEKINILNNIANCITVNKHKYKGENFKGSIYLCRKNKIEIMYFQSDDKKILIRENDYNSSNSKVVEEYQLLFDSIVPL